MASKSVPKLKVPSEFEEAFRKLRTVRIPTRTTGLATVSSRLGDAARRAGKAISELGPAAVNLVTLPKETYEKTMSDAQSRLEGMASEGVKRARVKPARRNRA